MGARDSIARLRVEVPAPRWGRRLAVAALAIAAVYGLELVIETTLI